MNLQIGQIVKGVINGVQQYGIFVRLDKKNEGLLHISEINKTNPSIKYKVGKEIKVMILDIDPFSNKISLSQRGLLTTAINIRRKKRHFWTSRSVRTGFEPLKQALPEEIKAGLKKYKKYLA
ncbi:S1 RNA-binding domain-containing protein [Lactobacillus sp. PV034]|uniref:S1 RNA-binding domain-containing protein n=1 Tax=Lactobacillus sp. PV034 TaxID=2594495 RepID=UPI00223F2AA0|nr:S1 RNA-binding domain-containing protein [Lactobacillus sp. PV034]QNQ81488.1 S1 RNA-binding domain-containing protein [Lactobacillus sp. PV034]